MSKDKRIPFSDPLSDRDLYWLGYIQADGCIRKRIYGKREYTYLSFGQKHERPVRELHEHIGANTKICLVAVRGYSVHNMFVMHCRNSVAELSVLGAKNKLREDIYASKHFWRGMIDGDGSVIIDGQGKPHLALCGNKYDLDKFMVFAAELNLEPYPIWFHKNCYYTRISCNKAVKMIAHLYNGEYSALDYKREKVETILSKFSRQLA